MSAMTIPRKHVMVSLLRTEVISSIMFAVRTELQCCSLLLRSLHADRLLRHRSPHLILWMLRSCQGEQMHAGHLLHHHPGPLRGHAGGRHHWVLWRPGDSDQEASQGRHQAL